MPRRIEITSRMVPLMLKAVRAQGGDADALVRRFGLESVLQDDGGDVRVPLSDFRVLVETAAAMVGDPYFGLHVAQAVPRGSYGLVEFILRSTDCVRTALRELDRYGVVVNEGVRFTFREERDVGVVEQRLAGEPEIFGRHGNEYALAVLVRIARDATGNAVPLRQVYFAHPSPADPEPLCAHFGTRQLEFDAGANGLVLGDESLSLPLQGADAELHAFLDRLGAEALAAKGQHALERIRDAIQEALRKGETGLEHVAARLHVSSRTLQRRLSEHGTSYQELLDDVRVRLARAYLKDARLGVAEVAYLLGYSELRAFDRAFRRWTGLSPREFRRGAS